MTTMEADAGAATLLRDAAGLGPVRVVLRSCSGFMELFCDTGAFDLTNGWVTVRRPDAHLHVRIPALDGACLLEAGGDAYPHAPSLWFLGRCGSPCLIIILDVATGDARARQDEAFRALRAQWGERAVFAGETSDDAERVLH